MLPIETASGLLMVEPAVRSRRLLSLASAAWCFTKTLEKRHRKTPGFESVSETTVIVPRSSIFVHRRGDQFWNIVSHIRDMNLNNYKRQSDVKIAKLNSQRPKVYRKGGRSTGWAGGRKDPN